jgi:hypothetical protein
MGLRWTGNGETTNLFRNSVGIFLLKVKKRIWMVIRGLLSFWTVSNVRYSKEHNVSETGSVFDLRWKGGRYILSYFTLLPEDGNRSSFRNVELFRMSDDIQSSKTQQFRVLHKIINPPPKIDLHRYVEMNLREILCAGSKLVDFLPGASGLLSYCHMSFCFPSKLWWRRFVLQFFLPLSISIKSWNK